MERDVAVEEEGDLASSTRWESKAGSSYIISYIRLATMARSN